MIRYCNKCGCPREHTVNPCPDCGALEFDCNPNPTYDGWCERQPPVQTTLFDEEPSHDAA